MLCVGVDAMDDSICDSMYASCNAIALKLGELRTEDGVAHFRELLSGLAGDPA